MLEKTEHHIAKQMLWEISPLDMMATRFQAYKLNLLPIIGHMTERLSRCSIIDLEIAR